MPSPTTAGDLVKGAMRLIGAIATGETPTANEMTDALSVLNDVLEYWNTQSLAVYQTSTEQFPTVGGQATYTIGPAGNWNTKRPVDIGDPAVCTFQGVDFPIDIIGQAEYDLIPLKTQQQSIIEKLLYVNDWPLGKITLWPVPNAVVTITLDTQTQLTAVTDQSTAISYPPGYAMALRYQLAIALAAEYGIEPSPTVIAIGRSSFAALKRTNRKKRTSQFDAGLATDDPVVWQRGY